MPKRGLPGGVGLRHDSHYVEELARASRAIGKTLPITKIEPNPKQPRSEIGDLTELADSIKQRGVLEPILVTPKADGTWMIIAGERRWRAAQLAGLTEIPCIELNVTEQEAAEIALIENLQRKDLTVWEEVDGLAALVHKFGYTHEEVAKKIGKSRTSVTEALAIASLPSKIRQRCKELNITSKSILLQVARQFDEASMIAFLRKLSEQVADKGKISRDEAKKLSKQLIYEDKSKEISKDSTSIQNKSQRKKLNLQHLCFSYLTEKKVLVEVKSEGASIKKEEVIHSLEEALNFIKSQG
jgi:ParB family chromosome partitioning protein